MNPEQPQPAPVKPDDVGPQEHTFKYPNSGPLLFRLLVLLDHLVEQITRLDRERRNLVGEIKGLLAAEGLDPSVDLVTVEVEKSHLRYQIKKP